jgi:YggT family protein
MVINLIVRIINIAVAVIGLALVLRVVLPWLRLSRSHPLMRFLVTVTDPLVRPVRRVLGDGGVRWTRGGAVDLAPMAAFFVLWLAQAIVTRLLYWITAPPLWILLPGQDLERWLVGVIGLLVQVYGFLLLLRILLEWIAVRYTHPVMRFLWNITEPLLAPIRRRLPIVAGLDFSPLVALLLVSVAQTLLVTIIRAVL